MPTSARSRRRSHAERNPAAQARILVAAKVVVGGPPQHSADDTDLDTAVIPAAA